MEISDFYLNAGEFADSWSSIHDYMDEVTQIEHGRRISQSEAMEIRRDYSLSQIADHLGALVSVLSDSIIEEANASENSSD